MFQIGDRVIWTISSHERQSAVGTIKGQDDGKTPRYNVILDEPVDGYTSWVIPERELSLFGNSAAQRDERGWLICTECKEPSEYAEPDQAGGFVCGECRTWKTMT